MKSSMQMKMASIRPTRAGPETTLLPPTRTRTFQSIRRFTGRHLHNPCGDRASTVAMRLTGGANAVYEETSWTALVINTPVCETLLLGANRCVDDPYSIEQLKAPRMNISVVRPLVETFYEMQDVSIGTESASFSFSLSCSFASIFTLDRVFIRCETAK